MFGLWAAVLVGEPWLWLPSVFSDHMVLQREKAIPVYGRATPGSEVFVELVSQKVATRADAEGRWRVNLQPLPAGGPHELVVRGPVRRVFRDVLIGEVWVCSGQSNMQWSVDASSDPAQEQAKSSDQIRLLTVPNVTAEEPQADVPTRWVVATPETIGPFSAVGFAFGRHLRDALGVPIGLINTSWGGTPAESWTSFASLSANPETRPIVDRYRASQTDYPRALERYREAMRERRNKEFPQESDESAIRAGWAQSPISGPEWQPIQVPGAWEKAADLAFNGALWYRLDVVVPETWVGADLILELGAVDDTDRTFFNGQQIGQTGAETPNWWSHPRQYRVPGALVRAGVNSIAVRVFDNGMDGGLVGPSAPRLVGPGGNILSLTEGWRYRIEAALSARPELGPAPEPPFGPGNPWVPATLYNSMIHPLAPYGIRGAIWYQGESNADRAEQYRTLLPLMISDWRRLWGQGEFPFYIVQLANFMARGSQPEESMWAELREAQAMVGSTRSTGLAVAIDIGDAEDIHPTNKREVGRRLSLIARNRVFGQKVEYSGPKLLRVSFEGGSARVRFSHARGLKTSDGRPPAGFAIAGADRKFVWATAKIVRDTVIVSAESVMEPVAVRYGWANNPDVNLVNSDGLPAIPFRSDDWPMLGAGRR
jgi:sialate O-acetylesterase